MTDTQAEPDAGTPSNDGRGTRLDSWKEIAAYLKRDVATVRRWEKREALPVQRHLHEKLGSVFAYTTALDTWSEGRLQKAGAEAEDAEEITAPAAVPVRQRLLPWSIAGMSVLGLALVLFYWAPWRPEVSSPALHLRLELGGGASLTPANIQFGESAVLSPDGSLVAFVAESGPGDRRLYLRRLDRLDAVPLSGTDGALSPFFSPDGRWVGFFAQQKLKKVAVTGGAPITIAVALSARGGAWSDDDTIVFSPHQIAGTHLKRVSSAGGDAEALTTLVDGEVIHLFPQVLPGGKAVLYTSSGVIGAYNNANIVVQSLSGGARKILYTGGYYARYISSGHLVFIHDGTLFAAPFDVDCLEIVGQPVPALVGVASNSQTGAAQFSAAANGTIVYVPGQDAGSGIPLHWMDHKGKATALLPAPGNWINPSVSPDGEQLGLEIRDPTAHIAVYHQGRLTRLTSGPGADQQPVWAPDGRWLAFGRTNHGETTSNLFVQRVDGIGTPVRLTESPNAQQPSSWHPSGKFVAFEEINARTTRDVMILPMEGDDVSGWKAGTARAFVNGPEPEFDAMFSPDGRWLAYVVLESGKPQVYVRPFPGPGGHWFLGAGASPTWSRSKPELFYGVNGQIMVTTYAVDGASFRADKARLWSDARYQTRGIRRVFDLHPDGERFALAPDLQPATESPLDTITMIVNFSDELRRMATTP